MISLLPCSASEINLTAVQCDVPFHATPFVLDTAISRSHDAILSYPPSLTIVHSLRVLLVYFPMLLNVANFYLNEHSDMLPSVIPDINDPMPSPLPDAIIAEPLLPPLLVIYGGTSILGPLDSAPTGCLTS